MHLVKEFTAVAIEHQFSSQELRYPELGIGCFAYAPFGKTQVVKASD